MKKKNKYTRCRSREACNMRSLTCKIQQSRYIIAIVCGKLYELGKIVGKKASANGKKAYKRIAKWTVAVQKARKALGVKGFVAVKKGSALRGCSRFLELLDFSHTDVFVDHIFASGRIHAILFDADYYYVCENIRVRKIMLTKN